ncbi:hypothetical protein [Desulfallas thermosapovorans]|uniref:Uncharacterized protein n=1 Tax=Desulfallas thermosapovorans DSM 6562 TaxID=1121431 RepID=A0A5S4ZVB8_9FIRM|nr:hypothetical protein [Desulfallas thermosapovorans]TYO96931.1 hypothetical protein LX24_00741 [Desulfallas thermosapovorans DSM 6562]
MDKYHRVVELWQSYQIATVEDLDKYLDSFRIQPLYEFFKYETEKTWRKALNLANGVRRGRKGLLDIT